MRKLFILLGVILSFHVYSQTPTPLEQVELMFLKKQYDSVLVLTNRFMESDSTNWMLYYYSGKSYQAKYKFFEAIQNYEFALQLDSANSIIENELADAYDFIGKDEEAISIYYNQFLRDTLALDPAVHLANLFRKNREYASAIHYYQKAVASDPENFYYYKQQGFCYDKINFPLGAIHSYRVAIMLNPHDAAMYAQLANIHNSERQFMDAIAVCNTGLKVYPEDRQMLKIKSYAHYLNHNYDSSLVGFSQLLEDGDSTFFNLKYRGLVFFEKKQFVNAIGDLLNANNINSNDPELCFYIGSAFARSNQNKDGLKYLNKSLRLLSPSPNELSNIYSEMAHAYLNEKKYEESLDYLKLAYKNNATPLLSFKMAQLYDYYLKNKKMAINYYDGYLMMSNTPDSLLLEQGVGDQTFFVDSAMLNNAEERIRMLKEDLFFESAKK